LAVTFLGFANFYRWFIRNFRKIAKPLHGLTGNAEWKWGKTAFEEQVMLAILDNEGKFWVKCNMSNYALGAVL
jgi:hypothetical protein